MYHTRQQPLFWIRSRGEGKRVGSFAEQRLLGPRLTKMVGYRKNSRLPEHKALYFVGIWWSTFCCDRYQEKFFLWEAWKPPAITSSHMRRSLTAVFENAQRLKRTGVEKPIVKQQSYNEIWSNITFIVDAMQHRSHIIDVRSKLLR